jgi:hypothetical protein
MARDGRKMCQPDFHCRARQGTLPKTKQETAQNEPGRTSMTIGSVTIKHTVIAALTAASVILIAQLTPSPVRAQDLDKVKAAMTLLQSKAEKLGPAKIEGTDTVADKTVPAVFFGTTKIDNNFDLVDEVVKEVGGTATIFVKSGADYVRVATNVKKADGSRAVGTILDPNGKVIVVINKNEAFYGEATILGKPYVTGYAPMHDAAGNVIGIYYVGYPKG